jgi:5-keto 4-deoxyuronate isomerase
MTVWSALVVWTEGKRGSCCLLVGVFILMLLCNWEDVPVRLEDRRGESVLLYGDCTRA